VAGHRPAAAGSHRPLVGGALACARSAVTTRRWASSARLEQEWAAAGQADGYVVRGNWPSCSTRPASPTRRSPTSGAPPTNSARTPGSSRTSRGGWPACAAAAADGRAPVRPRATGSGTSRSRGPRRRRPSSAFKPARLDEEDDRTASVADISAIAVSLGPPRDRAVPFPLEDQRAEGAVGEQPVVEAARRAREAGRRQQHQRRGRQQRQKDADHAEHHAQRSGCHQQPAHQRRAVLAHPLAVSPPRAPAGSVRSSTART